MKKLSNISLTILFSICTFLVIAFLTFFNPHFIIHEMEKYHYYEHVIDKMNFCLESSNIEYHYLENDLKNDIKKYVKSRYKDYYIGNKIDSVEYSESIYLEHVKFDNWFKDNHIHELTYILFITILMLVIVTGSIFIKTKKIHNIDKIMFFSSILLIISFGLIKIFLNINNDFIYHAIIDSSYYILGVGIVFLEVSIFKKIKNHFD